MKAKIAVATVNGRAYYQLVTELQRKRLPFLSLKPWDPIPLHITAVLTTEEESHQVSHPQILIFGQNSSPEAIVDEATLIVQGKQGYEKVVVGVDPGKTYGIAILGDNKVLATLTSSNIDKASRLVVDSLKRFPAEVKVVRVGDGPPEYTQTLLDSLNKVLPEETLVEIVSEAGTSRLTNKSVNRRVLKDAVSAIKIAERNGRILSRKNVA
ncbi:MAG TPA: hypothetical protein ENN36_08650 [Candidatus Bathyarchaeota archaeon]|nr:hypothetical protein [Candidatus Bathyarchaeota archaeon]